ncbi:universal stress protein [Microbacteriaceae bacterium VKM Ac-2855]|nr:universal stress protein [Microbacteriaceae bacterium VKM Ac-2855]
MSDSIVVGVTGSDQSTAALDWALQRAAGRHCSVELVTVVEDVWTGVGLLDETAVREAADQVLQSAREHARDRQPGLRIEARLLFGDPVVVLSEIAPAGGLLVLGAHHLGRLGGAITAPVAVRVAAATRSAVALIPPGADAPRRGIAVGVDGSPASLAAIAFAADEADRLDEPLLAVHAWQLPGAWADTVPIEKVTIDAIEADERLVFAESLTGLASRYPGLVVDRRLVRGSTVEALARVAADARLLVVGSHGRGAFLRLLLGSVSHSMALTMAGPLVVVRQH